MGKSRFNWARILVVTAVSICAGIAGYRTTADEGSSHSTFKGFSQQAYWQVPGGDAAVNCYESMYGPGKPDGAPTAAVGYNVSDWRPWWRTTSLSASGPINSNSMTYNQALSQTTRCGFTGLAGTLTTWDWNENTVTSTPVTVTANSALTAGDVQQGMNSTTETVRTSTGSYSIRRRSIGKRGLDITGLGGIAYTDGTGNVNAL